jgi:hypothetical protein
MASDHLGARQLRDLGRDLDPHPEDRGGEGLPLGIGHEGDGTTAVEGIVDQEVERVEIREFEALDGTMRDPLEVSAYRRGGHLFDEDRVELRAAGDDPEIDSISFIAGASMREV